MTVAVLICAFRRLGLDDPFAPFAAQGIARGARISLLDQDLA
jgi:hypothetical protein